MQSCPCLDGHHDDLKPRQEQHVALHPQYGGYRDELEQLHDALEKI